MTSVTVIGASGYIGSEILRLLVNHPRIEEIIPVSRSLAGKNVVSYLTHLRGFIDHKLKFQNMHFEKIDTDFLFVAAPPGKWIESIPSILDRGTRVISMGGKFRIKNPDIDKKLYPDYDNKSLLNEAVYGLPELYRKEIKKARFIANPGCYTTSIIPAIAPLSEFKSNLDLKSIVITSISGSSGAGIKLSKFLHHPNVSGNIRPYNILYHRHTPEMEFILSQHFNSELRISFTPSVGDYSRGILSYISIFTKKEIKSDIIKHFQRYYKREPFIRILSSDKDNIPNLKDVVNTNFCDIGVNYDRTRKRILLLSALDNLIKGGSGTAVQNMNIMLGVDERLGLNIIALSP